MLLVVGWRAASVVLADDAILEVVLLLEGGVQTAAILGFSISKVKAGEFILKKYG